VPGATDAIEIAEEFEYLFDPPLGNLRYRVGYGGRGSAKSWDFARALLIHGTQRSLRILCGREFQSSIKDSVHRLLVDQIHLLELRDFYDVWKKTIIGANGTEFLFKGLRRDIQEVKSTEGIDICWLEEAQAISDQSWETIIPTVRKEGSEIWATFNPLHESDATYQRMVVHPPARSIVRKHNYRDNPWLPAVLLEEAEQLKLRDPDAYEHVWNGGLWIRSKAAIFAHKCKYAEFEVPRDKLGKALWDGPYFGADWGFSQDPAVLLKLWVGGRRLYIEHEQGGIQLSFDNLERRFRRIPGADRYTIRADSSRPETIAEMRSRGFKVEAAPKWAGSVEDGIEHILNTYDEIIINPRCTLAQQEARLYRYKTDPKSGDVLPEIVDAHNHTWDAARYALAPLIRKRGFSTVKVRLG
jgi:phage terminase large subunit